MYINYSFIQPTSVPGHVPLLGTWHRARMAGGRDPSNQ